MRAPTLCTFALVATLSAFGAGCQSYEDTRPVDRGAARLAANHVVEVNADGSFTPQTTHIEEGDSVTFVGPGGAALAPTDAIVHLAWSDIGTANAAGTSCLGGTTPYDISHTAPEDDNELTGPLRRGAPGIFVLGPEDADGYFEGPLVDSCGDPAIVPGACDDLAVAAGAAPALPTETWSVVCGPSTMRCQKVVTAKKEKSKTTNSTVLLPSTWDNPSVAGGVVRINWRDLYTKTVEDRGGVSTEVYTKTYAKLDAELTSAANRGKLVLLEVLAGAGIPAWLFTDYATAVDTSATSIAAKSVAPVYTSDFGTDGGTEMPTANNCGYEKTMGSPADAGYRAAVLGMLADVARHIRANSLHYQALGSFKVTGLNFLTGEMRLPNRCLDPTKRNANGNPQTACVCNTERWAAAGYTHEVAQQFMNLVENTLFLELGQRKTMGFMLIQDGFPKVADGTHYDTEAAPVAPNVGYVRPNGLPYAFDKQTVDALNAGQAGAFRQVDAQGMPLLAPGAGDLDAFALFSPMHASLGPISKDPVTGLNDCPAALPTTLVGGKLRGQVVEPGLMSTNLADYGPAGSGCPNKWAAREGYEGQIIGYQNKAGLASTDELSASLWNATLNTNAVFVEVYENVLWNAEAERAGAVLSTSADGYSDVPERQKSLADWAVELRDRRRTIAGFPASVPNRHMADPHPAAYTFTFAKDLPAGQTTSYYFVNPAARCASATLRYGQIEVNGH